MEALRKEAVEQLKVRFHPLRTIGAEGVRNPVAGSANGPVGKVREVRMRRRVTWIMAAVGLSACGPSERNVITERAPFFSISTSFEKREANKIVGEVRRFAVDHRMDFLLSHDEPDKGDFNASANGRGLNLSAMHVGSVEDGLSIFAIASDEPTASEVALTEEFLCRVAKKCEVKVRGSGN